MIRKGLSRLCFTLGPLAFKVPYRYVGWLDNQSEWHTGNREMVNKPLMSIFALILIFHRATLFGGVQPGFVGDESKPSSWGYVKGRWVLIDFARSHQRPFCSWFAKKYYEKLEGLAVENPGETK